MGIREPAETATLTLKIERYEKYSRGGSENQYDFELYGVDEDSGKAEIPFDMMVATSQFFTNMVCEFSKEPYDDTLRALMIGIHNFRKMLGSVDPDLN